MAGGGEAAGRDQPLVFIGDSITAGWAAYRPELFARHRFLARGVPGETSGQIRARFARDITGARGVHLLCGINDIAEVQGSVPDATIRGNIAAMTDAARTAGLSLWIGAVMPSDFWGWRPELKPVARIRALNVWLAAHAQACGAGFVDYHTPLATRTGALRPDVTDDGIHLTASGYLTVEPALLAALVPGLPVR